MSSTDRVSSHPQRSALRARVITAIVLIVGMLVALFALPPAVGMLALALVILGGAWEWAGFFGTDTRSAARVGYAAAIGVLMVLCWSFTELDPHLYGTLLWTA